MKSWPCTKPHRLNSCYLRWLQTPESLSPHLWCKLIIIIIIIICVRVCGACPRLQLAYYNGAQGNKLDNYNISKLITKANLCLWLHNINRLSFFNILLLLHCHCRTHCTLLVLLNPIFLFTSTLYLTCVCLPKLYWLLHAPDECGNHRQWYVCLAPFVCNNNHQATKLRI